MWLNGNGLIVRNNNNRISYEKLRQNRLYCTNVATKTQTSLKFYSRRVGDSWDATRFTNNYTSETGRLLWSDNTYPLCWKLLRFTSTVFKEQYLLVILFRKINQFTCDKRFITFVQMSLYPQKTCKSLVLFTNANMHT